MSQLSTQSVAQPQERKIEQRAFVKRIGGFALLVTAVGMLAVSVDGAVTAQDKYSLQSPSGVPFSDFRGYEDWAVVSTAKTDVLKAIVANPAMIKAYKTGVPGGGRTFP